LTSELQRIIDRLDRERLLAEPPPHGAVGGVRVESVTTDSRAVKPGGLFCAVPGTVSDGHDYLAAAAAAGAVAAVVERVDATVAIPQVRVRCGRLAAAYTAAELYGDPWTGLTLVGITGTNGKTTSAAILRHLLSRRGPAASVGTLGVIGADGRVVPGSDGLTTPGPIELAAWLYGLAQEGMQSVAMEVSSHALHQGRAAAVRFDAALFTNLSRDHLDYHGTFEEYRAAKLRLLELLEPDGVAAFNVDDPAWRNVDQRHGRQIRFGIEHAAEVGARSIRLGAGGMLFELVTPDAAAEVVLPLFGEYNVANALGVAAVLWGLGWHPEEIAYGLAELPQVSGRLELVPTPGDVATLLIDYAHTPDALGGALAALRPLAKGRVIVVFGAGGDRDVGKRPEMGRVAAAGADLTIVTSDNPRTEDPERIADQIESGMGRAPRLRILDRREAIRHALEVAAPEDLILLAGKGHETYQIWGSERRHFDEREVVREILDERGENG
jgi:UDP-N-acetylmuramoyl-L-alanyl-D-glutamate--2,6-diaminopimelate ligase